MVVQTRKGSVASRVNVSSKDKKNTETRKRSMTLWELADEMHSRVGSAVCALK